MPARLGSIVVEINRETRNTVTYMVGIAIIISQAAVGALGGTPSALLVGAALMILGVPVADALDRKNKD